MTLFHTFSEARLFIVRIRPCMPRTGKGIGSRGNARRDDFPREKSGVLEKMTVVHLRILQGYFLWGLICVMDLGVKYVCE